MRRPAIIGAEHDLLEDVDGVPDAALIDIAIHGHLIITADDCANLEALGVL